MIATASVISAARRPPLRRRRAQDGLPSTVAATPGLKPPPPPVANRVRHRRRPPTPPPPPPRRHRRRTAATAAGSKATATAAAATAAAAPPPPLTPGTCAELWARHNHRQHERHHCGSTQHFQIDHLWLHLRDMVLTPLRGGRSRAHARIVRSLSLSGGNCMRHEQIAFVPRRQAAEIGPARIHRACQGRISALHLDNPARRWHQSGTYSRTGRAL